jgi:chloramphenicol 3-O-phosphotransferase
MEEPYAASARRAFFLRLLSAVAEADVPVEYGLTGASLLEALMPLALARDLEIAELVILGDRVDITARSHDREWAVVLGVPATDPTLVNFVAVFERPPAFAGVVGGFVIVLRGVSGAGKTSLMAAFCERAPTPWLRFDDHMFGELPLRFLIWPGASGPLRAGFFAALPVIAGCGNQIITVAHTDEQSDWSVSLADVPHLFVRLDCGIDVLQTRALRRGDRRAGLVSDGFARIDEWRYDLRIDTSHHSPEAAAHILLDAVLQRQGGAPERIK